MSSTPHALIISQAEGSGDTAERHTQWAGIPGSWGADRRTSGGLLRNPQSDYHRTMANKILTPAQIAYLQLLDVPVPEGLATRALPATLQQKEAAATRKRSADLSSVDFMADIPVLSAEAPLAEEPSRHNDLTKGKSSSEILVPPSPGESSQQERAERISRMDWPLLEASIHACRACSLGESRQHAVVGAGTRPGPWLFVGEAPGAEEDRRGEAFVGRGGQLLDAMLGAMGLSRQEQVYIANVLKCRPPQNRDPLGPEVHACLPFLQRQIALLQPRIIVALGRFAAQSLLQNAEPLANLRGTVQRYDSIPLIVTYHPAYLLRNPIEKRKVWEDLKLALQTYADLPQGREASASATE